jgi:propanol-preferring alcohol dehydrogenase
MVLKSVGSPLVLEQRATPVPKAGEVLLRVAACAVCRTDLHVVDGELPDIKLPIVPGHEIVGYVEQCGEGVNMPVESRMGVPWLGHTCGHCFYCEHHQENLCDAAEFTGYQRDGGYADYVIADANYGFALPDSLSDVEAAPLLCAGLIGYRSLRMTSDAKRLGIYGFGAAGHIITQVALWQGREVYAFTRHGDVTAQQFARSLGVQWAGDSEQAPPQELDAAIIFAPVGALVPLALKATRKGGVVVCGGIHMSDIPQFPYSSLWGERQIRSVANLTRADAEEFLALAPQVPIKTHTQVFPLADANIALQKLRHGELSGAAVLVP